MGRRALLLSVVSLLVASVSSAQWVNCTSTSSATCTTANVGIGTTSAGAPLTIMQNAAGPLLWIGANNGSSTFLTLSTTATSAEMNAYLPFHLHDGGGASRIYLPNYGGDAYFLNLGKFGIGTATPNSLLTVAGTSGVTRMAVGRNTGSDADGRLLLKYDTASDVAAIDSYHGTFQTLELDGSILNLNRSSAGQVVIGPGGPSSTKKFTVNGDMAGTSLALSGGLSATLPGSGTIFWLGANGGNSTVFTVSTTELNTYAPLNLRDGGGTSRVYLPNYGGDAYFTNLGNVGVGTKTPNSLFTVAAPSGVARMVVGRSTGSDLDGRVLVSYDTAANTGAINALAAGTYRALDVDSSLVTLNKTSAGQVVIGAGGPHASDKLTVNGDVTVTGNIGAKYQDVAEWVPVTAPMAAGTVVVVNADSLNTVSPSEHSYDTSVAGVVSAQPGLILGEEAPSKARIATTGRVKVRVTASGGAVRAGDLLVTSDKPGVAMRSQAIEVGGVKIHRPGTLIGKALEPLNSGEGEILVLLSLQ